jgi:hypothetical protein
MGEGRDVYKVLVGKPKGKRSIGKPRRSWASNNKLDLQEVGCEDRHWFELDWTCESGNETLGSFKYRILLDWLKTG